MKRFGGLIRNLLFIFAVAGFFAAHGGCDAGPATPIIERGSEAGRIIAPQRLDTLYVGQPFRLRASIECHNPIIGIRMELTDNTRNGPFQDGEIAWSAWLPTPFNVLEVEVDTILTIESMRAITAENRYALFVVEEYEGREYRAGFSPVYVLR